MYGEPGDKDEMVFVCKVLAELRRAREKFPDNRHLMNALTEEVGELARALLHLNFEKSQLTTSQDVYKEAVQVAVVALRLATEGDSTLPEYKPMGGDTASGGRCERCNGLGEHKVWNTMCPGGFAFVTCFRCEGTGNVR